MTSDKWTWREVMRCATIPFSTLPRKRRRDSEEDRFAMARIYLKITRRPPRQKRRAKAGQ
jgi:hypothetical protein